MGDIFVAIFRKYYVPQALFTKIYFTPGYLPYRNSFPYASGDTTLCNYKKLKTTCPATLEWINIQQYSS